MIRDPRPVPVAKLWFKYCQPEWFKNNIQMFVSTTWLNIAEWSQDTNIIIFLSLMIQIDSDPVREWGVVNMV